MKKLYSALVISLFAFTTFAQNKMRPVEELVNLTEPGWTLVQQWIDNAKNKIEILKCDTSKAKDALFKTQASTRSPMGAIIYSTGGILVDYGWIRILGSGNLKLNRTLPDWNKGRSFNEFGKRPPFLLIADDAIARETKWNAGLVGCGGGQ